MLMHLHPAFVSCLALFVYLWTVLACGAARSRHNIPAPATNGPPEFERQFRVQQNTLEQLVLFLPSLWLFCLTVHQFWGAVIGLLWVVARVAYGIIYVRNPDIRGTPFILALLCTVVLLVGAFIKIIFVMITGIP